MDTEQTSATAHESWEYVLTRSRDLPLRFDVMAVADDKTYVRIRNIDRTVTVLRGRGFAVAQPKQSRSPALLSGGTITALERLDADGRAIDLVDGLDLPVAADRGGVAFTSPPPGMTSLQWVFEHVDLYGSTETGAPLAPGVHVGGLGGKGLSGGRIAPRTFLFAALPVAAVVAGGLWMKSDPIEAERVRWKMRFAAPASVPHPASNVPSAARIALGRQLFFDTQLSADGTVSCATCHDPARGFSDGVAYGKGIAGQNMTMHSPVLWNLAWGNAMFWDGRLATLEAQALAPIENPKEMGETLGNVVTKLKTDSSYVRAFAGAFPEDADVSQQTLAKALASYVRSLVSPPTRFDAWLAGQSSALTASEKQGFSIFVGKGGCANCHSGWAFSDFAFHDIGLATNDRGRGHVIGRPVLNLAFKTPTLRELTWSAPYMHDGSMKTLEDVVRHYEGGGVDRATRSPDMPRRIDLSDRQRADLVSFLKTLSSPEVPQTSTEKTSVAAVAAAAAPGGGERIGQRGKQFSLERVRVLVGQALTIFNDDNQGHNVFIDDPRMKYDSGWQHPGDQTKITFDTAGDFQLFCGVHPNMRLHVEVQPTASK